MFRPKPWGQSTKTASQKYCETRPAAWGCLSALIRIRKIQNLDLDLNTSTNNDSLGIELLADPKKTAKTDGYSSGEEKAPSPKKDEFNLFNDNDIKDLKIDDNPVNNDLLLILVKKKRIWMIVLNQLV